MMKQRLFFACALAVAVLAPVASARTVSVWPIEDAEHGGLRSAIDARYDFANLGGNASAYPDQTVGWNLPPNPDATEAYLFEPVNRKAQQRATLAMINTSTNITMCVMPTKNFTFEGWLYLTSLPTGDGWVSFALGAGSSGSVNTGWMLQFFPTDKTANPPSWQFAIWRGTSALAVSEKTALAADQLMNKWIHLAITYAADNGAGKNEFRVYVDGVQCLRESYNKRTSTAIDPKGANNGLGLALGGRTDRPIVGYADYWRLSDETLTPERFLNAGGSGTIVPDVPVVKPSTKTVAYWTLNAKDGAIDARDHVGTAHLSDWYGDAVVTWPMSVHDDTAFTGAVAPNTNTVLRQANTCSFLNQNTSSYLAATNLLDGGAFLLDLDRAFTVEGWFKPVRRTADAPSAQYLFSTRNNSNAIRGWSLFLQDGRLHLIVQDGTGSAANLVDKALDEDLAEWGETWKHVALAYDPATGGTGEWRCYLDGILVESTRNANAPASGGTSSKFLVFAGNPNTQSSFFGAIDCVRVSAAALAPKQLMCCTAEDAAAATCVVALWPLNGAKGFMMDGHDEITNGSANNLYKRATGLRTVSCEPSAEKPAAISNPDTSLNFDGDPSARDGSAAFTHAGFKYLASRDATVSSAIGNAGTWTMEGYLRRTDSVSGTFGVFFATYNTTTPNNAPTFLHGLKQYNNNFMLGGVELAGTAPALNTWCHFAIVTENVPSKSTVCTLYLDGAYKGCVTNSAAKLSVGNSASFSFGGMGNTPRSFPGQLCHLRLSKGALAPEEFLCAAKQTPEPTPAVTKATVAYWPLDRGAVEADTETRLAPSGYALYRTVGVTGAAARARSCVPNRDVTFDRANDGSVDLAAGGSAGNGSLGRKLDLTATWTVEGWIREHAQGAGRRTICGTYGASRGGWKLWVETIDGVPTFGLHVRPGLAYTACLDRAIVRDGPARWEPSDWNHLALVHTPQAATGEWTLYVNGLRYGAIDDDWRNGYLESGTGDFALGDGVEADASFAGGFDMWRVSTGALEAEDFLYRARQGMLLLFR